MQPGSDAYTSSLQALTAFFQGQTGNAANAQGMAQGAIYQQLNQQAAAMAYQDIFRLLCWMAGGMVFCAFLLSKNRPGQGMPKGEAVH